MSYIQKHNWLRWYKRCTNLAHELEAISKGIEATDIKCSREISELSHLTGAYKYLRFASRNLLGGYTVTKNADDDLPEVQHSFNEPIGGLNNGIISK